MQLDQEIQDQEPLNLTMNTLPDIFSVPHPSDACSCFDKCAVDDPQTVGVASWFPNFPWPTIVFLMDLPQHSLHRTFTDSASNSKTDVKLI